MIAASPLRRRTSMRGLGSQAAGLTFTMAQSALDAFVPFSVPLEGETSYMYTDAEGLVHTGIGNKIDTGSGSDGYPPALLLPWQVGDGGALAASSDVIAEWQKVKAAFPGVTSTGDAAITALRLSPSAVQALVYGRLKQNETYLLGIAPSYPAWPADAQLGVHGLMWAVGAGLNLSYPSFLAACNRQDFASAAVESHCSNCAPARNTEQAHMFRNAATVVSEGLPRDVLYYPGSPAPNAAAAIVQWALANPLAAVFVMGAGSLALVNALDAQMLPAWARASSYRKA